MDLFRSSYLILKKNNEQLRAQLKNIDVNHELLDVRFDIDKKFYIRFF